MLSEFQPTLLRLNLASQKLYFAFLILKSAKILNYRSGTVNSKSFIGKDFRQVKWKIEQNYTLKFKFF